MKRQEEEEWMAWREERESISDEEEARKEVVVDYEPKEDDSYLGLAKSSS